MRRHTWLTILTLTWGFALFAQTPKIDSLKKELNKNSLSDTGKIRLYLQLSKLFIKQDIDSAKYYVSIASNFAHSINNADAIASCYMSEGNVAYETGDFENAIKNYKIAITTNPKHSKRVLAEYYSAMGLTYWQMEEFAKGEYYFKLCLKSYLELNDNQKISTTYNNLGSLYGSEDKTTLASEYFYKALKIKELLGDSLGIAGCYINLSNVYQRLGDYNKSLSYSIAARDIRIRANTNPKELTGVYNNIGVAFDALGKHQDAMKQFRIGIDLAENHHSPHDLTQLYCNIGQTFLALHQTDSAIFHLNKSLAIAEQIGDDEGKMYDYNYLADIYASLKKFALAIDYAKKSLAIAEKIESVSMIADNAGTLYQIYKSLNDSKTALAWLEKNKSYNDSLRKIENIHEISELNYHNQIEDRDNAIKFLSNENEVKNQENKMQRLYIYIFVCLAILILSFSYLYYKQVKLLSDLNRQLEQQNIKIASQSEKLTQMNQLKDRVISVMSHDLRSPINSLYSIVEMFNAKQLSHEEMEALFPELGKTVNSVSILLENILAWVKSQMIQDSSLNVTQFNLHSAIEEIVKLYQPSASQKHLTIKNLILPSLEIKTDKNDLELIIRNLVNNAIKFSNLGQTIELCAEQKDKEWVISVKDNGVGMTEAELQKLFNPDKLHTSIGTNKEKGTGLGLLLVKVSVEKLKGKLSIDSQKGMGSQFNISLPVE